MRTETRNLRHPSVEIGFAIDATIATEVIDQEVDVLVVAAGHDRECPTRPSHYQNFITDRDSNRSPPIRSQGVETRVAPSRAPIRCRAPPAKRGRTRQRSNRRMRGQRQDEAHLGMVGLI
jgi:hypothetical protein